MKDLGGILTLVGVALVAAGVGLLGFLGVAIFQIIDAPENVGIVKLVLAKLAVGEKMIYGHSGSEAFELSMTEPALTVILLFLAVMIFSMIAGIAKAIIAAGVNMIGVMSSMAKVQADAPQPGPPVGRVE